MALDKSADDARPYIERAAPRHPALIDTEHVVADLFNLLNVPTVYQQITIGLLLLITLAIGAERKHQALGRARRAA